MIDEFYDNKEANRVRKLASGKPVVTLPYIFYSDDTSGNKTKKYVCCIIIAGLPRKENAQLHNIHFVCCSNQLSMLEMSKPIASEMKELAEQGIEIYDAFLAQNVLLLPRPICFICDNPRASELSNHLGSSAIQYCRKCKVYH